MNKALLWELLYPCSIFDCKSRSVFVHSASVYTSPVWESLGRGNISDVHGCKKCGRIWTLGTSLVLESLARGNISHIHGCKTCDRIWINVGCTFLALKSLAHRNISDVYGYKKCGRIWKYVCCTSLVWKSLAHCNISHIYGCIKCGRIWTYLVCTGSSTQYAHDNTFLLKACRLIFLYNKDGFCACDVGSQPLGDKV